jgi:cell division septal protein FtsQ
MKKFTKKRIRKGKKFKLWLWMKVLVLVLAILLVLSIYNINSLYRFLPNKYRPFIERINDVIFGKVEIIEITGNNLVSKEEVLSYIYKDEILEDDVVRINSESKIEQSLMKLPIIEFVSIKRFLPNKMVVHMKEKKIIMRLWDEKTKEVFTITEGGEILKFNDYRLKAPLIIGEFDLSDIMKLYSKLEKADLIKHTTEIISFYGFRFDVVFKKKLLVNLPEENLEEAINKMQFLIDNGKIFEKKVKNIDLRVKNKIFLSYFKSGEGENYTPPQSYLIYNW